MRTVMIFALALASGACVNIDTPKQVAECAAGGICRDRSDGAGDHGSQKDAAAVMNKTDGSRDAGDALGAPSVCGQDDGGGIVCRPAPGACDAPASAPTGLLVTAGDRQLGLSWTAVPGTTQYRVSRNMTKTGTFTQVGLTKTTSYLDQSLTNGTTYYYVVAAGNGSCWSADSAVTSGMPVSPPTPTDPDVPSAPVCLQPPPTNLQASPSGSVQVTLTWTAATPAPTTYGIWRRTVNDSGYQSIGSVAGMVTSYKDADPTLLKDTKYIYQVTADGSCTATSSEVSATTACLSPDTPAAPTVSNSNGAMTVTWPAVARAAAYSVHRDTSTTGSFANAVSTNQTDLTYTDAATSLTNGLTYYYKISASNAAGQCVSAQSKDGSAMSCAPPDVPSGLKASLRGLKQVALTWTASMGASQYAVLRKTSSSTEVEITPPGTPLTTTSYMDSGMDVDTTYYYRVRAHNGVNSACSSTPSAEAMATPTSCVVLPGSKNNYIANTTKAYCFVTCWDFPLGDPGVGMNTVNFSGRTFTINGLPMTCSTDCTLPKDLTKDYSMYPTTGAYVFRVTAGPDTSAANAWWSSKPGRDCQ